MGLAEQSVSYLLRSRPSQRLREEMTESSSNPPWKWKAIDFKTGKTENNKPLSQVVPELLRETTMTDGGALGAGVGAGAGCGVGMGLGVVGSAGFGSSAWYNLSPILGIGIGCGVGVGVGYGFGYGAGLSWESLRAHLLKPRKSKSKKRIRVQI